METSVATTQNESITSVEVEKPSILSVVTDQFVTVVVEAPVVLTDEMRSYVVTEIPDVQVVALGQQGPEGAQGLVGPAGAVVITKVSGQALSGHHLVVLNAAQEAIYASNNDITHARKVLGMTTGASVYLADATIVTSGEIYEPTWNWVVGGPVFLGVNGLLTQTPPVPPAQFLLNVGFALSTTRLFVTIAMPITIN